jgi:hypothetical protein
MEVCLRADILRGETSEQRGKSAAISEVIVAAGRFIGASLAFSGPLTFV